MASTWVKSNINENECVNQTNVSITCSAFEGKKVRTKNISFQQCIVGDDNNQPVVTNTFELFQYPLNAVSINACDFITLNFTWSASDGSDFNTASEFLNTNITGIVNNVSYQVDNVPIGTNMSGNSNPLIVGTASESYNNALMRFGGDNNQSGNENLCINIKNLVETYGSSIPNIIEIKLWGTWNDVMYNGDIGIKIDTFYGGTMSQSGYNFINQGGFMLNTYSVSTNVNSQNGNSSYSSTYAKIGSLYIDKNTKKTNLVLGWF